VLHFGSVTTGDYLALECLGPTLADVHRPSGDRFSLAIVCCIAGQAICRVDQLHSRNFVHRGINPSSFRLWTRENSLAIYLVDFSRARPFLAPDTQCHILFRTPCEYAGNNEFVSINSQVEYEQSRCDDMEPLLYVLVAFFKGALPWSIEPTTGNTSAELRRVKARATISTICAGMLQQIHRLRFGQRPDYDAYRKTLRAIRQRPEEPFDWQVSSVLAAMVQESSKLPALPPIQPELGKASSVYALPPIARSASTRHRIVLPVRSGGTKK
jgi:serine/threonine protein kinase